ncbi:MAG: hypothetical protein Q9179_004152 [Wetmoreana sp. 5 TL-2023]
MWPDESCNNSMDAINNAKLDVSYLAHAALRALHNPNATNQAPSVPISGPVNPAQHYFYFFDNNMKVAETVADIFRSIAACADGHDCPNNLILCGPPQNLPQQCANGIYGFVRDPNQKSQALNNRPKGGGAVWLCDAGLALPRNPPPCSTGGGADSLGYALLYEMVQVDVITRPDRTFLQQRTGYPNITTLAGEGVKETLMEIGWGINGNGLKGKGLSNAENYARFASWSWDLGFGGQPWGGITCEGNFERRVQQIGLHPVEG